MKNQKGIALIETILIILILVIIGFGGYYVWHAQKQTDKVNKDTVAASNSTTSQKTSTNSPAKYFTISQWGVRAPYSDSVTLKYAVFKDNPNGISFSSDEIEAADPTCKVDLTTTAGYAGVIVRYKDGAEFITEDGSDSGQTVEQSVASMDKSNYKHVGNYYYIYQHPQGLCGQAQSSVDAETSAQSAVKSILANLQAIPQ